MNEKKVVRYSKVYGNIVLGLGAFVLPVDHPDTVNVVNGEVCTTAPVLSYDETTEIFVTANTVWIPA